jgi:hypothetical protein
MGYAGPEEALRAARRALRSLRKERGHIPALHMQYKTTLIKERK